MCLSEGWVNNHDEDTPDGEDANDDCCWEEDETPQQRHFGSGAGAVNSPPGLHDAFGDAGWTMMTRRSRNRTNFTSRDEYLGKRGTALRSLWDDDDTIRRNVADDRTMKGLVNFSAAVDSGAEANALPENMTQWVKSQVSLPRCRSR